MNKEKCDNSLGNLIRTELERNRMSQAELAHKAGEHTQTISAIMCGSRAMTIALSLKLDTALGLEPGTLALAQTRFQIALEEQRKHKNIIERQKLVILRKIKANGGLWSYDGIPKKLDEDSIIEEALLHLDLEDMPLIFQLWSRAHIKRIWKEKLVSQGSRLNILNFILAVKVFAVNDPDKYLLRNAYV